MPSSFENLFGIPKGQIHPLCLLTPFLTQPLIRGLELTERFRGKPYAGFSHPNFTLIETRMGPLFTGDAILNLANSPCRTIILIGACGSLNEQLLPIGSLVSPSASFAIESFSSMCAGRLSFEHNTHARPNPLLKLPDNLTTSDVQCASVGSIALEHEFAALFIEKNISILDMECASVFCAAEKLNIHAVALLYITDIIGKTSPYAINSTHNIKLIEDAQEKTARMILALAQKTSQ